MDLDPSVVWDFAGTLVGTLRERPRQLPATVSRVDPDGTVWLSMPGTDGLVPASTTADVGADDAVTVEWWGNAYHVTGNGTSPSIGTRAAAALRRATAAAAKVAGEAKGIADAVGQHFWADDNGVHVSNEDGNATGERNILMNSLGILLRQGSAWLASFSDSAVAFFDGLGNVVAQFGSDGAQIGNTSDTHLEMDYHSMELIDKEGNTYFHVSDLRDSTGFVEITEARDAGNSRVFILGFKISSIVSVKINGVETTEFTWNNSITSDGRLCGVVTFNSAPGNQAVLTFVYLSDDDALKAYTFGYRDSTVSPGGLSVVEGYNNTASGFSSHSEGGNNTASGYASHAEGQNTIASGFASHAEGNTTTASASNSHAEGQSTTASGYASHAEGWYTTASGYASHAQNRNTIAAKDNQTAIGRYNIEDTETTEAMQKAFIIGNGTSDAARSNAFAVGWDGTVYTAKDTDTTTVSDVLTAAQGVTIGAVSYIQRGGVAALFIRASRSAATSGATTIGTLVTGKRPVMETAAPAPSGSGDVYVAADGTVTYRPSGTVAAGSNLYVRITYLVA